MTALDHNIIVRFITGECSEEELRVIHQWIQDNPEEAGELFAQAGDYEAMQAMGMPEAKVQKAFDRVRKRIARLEEQQAVQTPVYSLLGRWRYYAATIAILVIAGLSALWWNGHRDTPETQLLMVCATQSVPQKVVLPDGSRIWLNENATLYYPRTFAHAERRVKLIGEGYFEVSKDRSRPFIVESKAMSVKVLGTKFNFKNDSVANCSEVMLVEGSVEVSSKASNGQLVLLPGQKARLDYRTGYMTVAQVSNNNDVAWHYDFISFSNATVRDIAQKLEKIYNITIEVSSTFDNHNTYTGRVVKKQTVEEVFKTLQHTLPIEYTKINKITYRLH